MESQEGEGQTAKVLDIAALKAFKKEADKTGIVYLSRIPPLMKPQDVRNHLSPFGEITRVYLTPADAKNGKKGGQQQKKNAGMFIDGWVEFKSKRSAKNAALALNGTPIGGSKRSKVYGEMWALKYLSKFKWTHLTEQIAYERAVREQKLRAEISQAKREAGLYLKQVERAQTNEKIAAKRAAKNPEPSQSNADADMEAIRKRFRQRKPIQQKHDE